MDLFNPSQIDGSINCFSKIIVGVLLGIVLKHTWMVIS